MNALRPGTLQLPAATTNSTSLNLTIARFLQAATDPDPARGFGLSGDVLFGAEDLLDDADGDGRMGRVARAVLALGKRGRELRVAANASSNAIHLSNPSPSPSPYSALSTPRSGDAPRVCVDAQPLALNDCCCCSWEDVARADSAGEQRSGVAPRSPTSPTMKRWTPPSPSLPTVRSDSPAEESAAGEGEGAGAGARA